MPTDYDTSTAPAPTSAPASAHDSAAAQRDADIAANLQAGHVHQAFEMLVQRYESKVFRLCMAMLRDPHAAQDVAQDSLLRVWRSLAGYKSDLAALSTWIYAITRNQCLTELARNKQANANRLEANWDEIEQLPDTSLQHDPSGLKLLQGLVNALPPAYQTCLKLYYFEELSVDEVADMLALPHGTVKTHLHRARLALHQALQARGLAYASLWL